MLLEQKESMKIREMRDEETTHNRVKKQRVGDVNIRAYREYHSNDWFIDGCQFYKSRLIDGSESIEMTNR